MKQELPSSCPQREPGVSFSDLELGGIEHSGKGSCVLKSLGILKFTNGFGGLTQFVQLRQLSFHLQKSYKVFCSWLKMKRLHIKIWVSSFYWRTEKPFQAGMCYYTDSICLHLVVCAHLCCLLRAKAFKFGTPVWVLQSQPVDNWKLQCVADVIWEKGKGMGV